MDRVDCKKCVYCYEHEYLKGEYWCYILSNKGPDGLVFSTKNKSSERYRMCDTFKPINRRKFEESSND